MIETKELKIKCADNFELAGTFYEARNLKGAVLIAPATGIKRRFYHAFATFLAENGYNTLTFDNRGIGDSKSGDSINEINASLVNWGKLDMPAALTSLKMQSPNTTNYHLVGHSAGGQLLGLMDNGGDFKSMFNYAASSGSMSNMTYPFKFSATFFLNFFIPMSNLFFGLTNSHWVGMGEPLPKKVAAQWRRWCNGQGYVKTDFGHPAIIEKHYYEELSLPSMWVHATDDGIANLANVKDMISVHPNIRSEIVTLEPAVLGYKELGHMKFFSSKKKELWGYALDWLGRIED